MTATPEPPPVDPRSLHLEFPRCLHCTHLRGGHHVEPDKGCVVRVVSFDDGVRSEKRCGCTLFQAAAFQ